MRWWHDTLVPSGGLSQVATFHSVIMLKSLVKVIPELKVHRRLFELGVWGDFSICRTTVPSPGSCVCLLRFLLEIIGFFSSDNEFSNENIFLFLAEDSHFPPRWPKFLNSQLLSLSTTLTLGQLSESFCLYFPTQQQSPGGSIVQFLPLCFLLP